MNLQDCYIEEDLFPKIFTKAEERDYGILFYNTENKDSFDSNYAVIYEPTEEPNTFFQKTKIRQKNFLCLIFFPDYNLL